MTTRSITITCVLAILLAIITLVGIDHYGRNSRVIGQTGTIQAQNIGKRLVDSPADAYHIWRDAGYQGRTIVYVADRWESFDPGELIPIQFFRAYPLQLYNTARLLENEYLNGTTLLYVASMNNIIRKIVAVMPENEVGRLAVAARSSKDYRVSSKEVFVSRQGFPRWYTTGVNYTYAGEPVLLFIGASYFKSADPKDLYRQISASGMQMDSIILCNEMGKNSVSSGEIAKLAKFAQLIGVVL
ncbi:MAG: hypothetical protein PHY09_05520 [Desulfuromonadaceae bacterium]|nr:hypothetical protein [Desulfuromonadaceae bacterium]MDD5107288.1 hypothetical protein [Desulfuromonadaceae bacterium]